MTGEPAAVGERPGDVPETRRQRVERQARALVVALRDSDEAAVEAAVIDLSRSRRAFAPLVFAVGAVVMLFQGVRLLFSNWRLTLIQVLPAMWVWFAMIDLRLHVFKDSGFHVWHGASEILLIAAIALVTCLCFYLNAVFAFAISMPGTPRIGPAFAEAGRHLRVVLVFGIAVGVALGVSMIIAPKWGDEWFALTLGIMIGVLMFTYVTVPARTVGIQPVGSRRDKIAATLIGGALGVIVCTPAYVIGRIGLLMLGSDVLFIVGVVLLALGLTLQAGATGAVKAIKMSAKLAAGNAAPAAPQQ
jgi:hypothetical protein